MADRFLKLEQLQRYHGKVKETFVAKEHKTDSEDEWKVLSDNNLTDELVQKIHNAGDSGFNGAYSSLTGKPQINGVELGTETSLADLDVVEGVIEDGSDGTATIRNDRTGGVMSYRPATGKAGLVAVDSGKNSDAQAKVMMRVVDGDYNGVAVYGNDTGFYYRKGTGLATDAKDEILTKRDIEGLATTESIEQDYAKKDQVSEDIETAKGEVKEEVLAEAKTLVTGVYTPKGSVPFEELPTPSAENVGWVYDVNQQFTTDDKFQKEHEVYPAGTNVVVVDNGGEDYKFDVLSGAVDLSGYMLKSDVEAITDGEIDALFTE